MLKKRLLIIALGLSVALTGLCGAIYAMASVEVTNEFETGIVDIALTEYQKDGEEEILWEDNPIVLPGAVVSKIPRISNDGNDCYVRAKITFRDIDEIDESNLEGISDKWVKADDGYYYYTEILPHGEEVDIFQAVNIPVDLSQEKYEGKSFYIDIDVDAIQSQNFTPNFDMAAPWGDIEILTNEKTDYDVSTFKPSDTQSFEILYQGETEQLTKNADDFFANIPNLMPGDTYSDTVELVNDGKDPIILHFRSVVEDDSDLLDKIQLKITTEIAGETVVFYDGNLRAVELVEDSILGTIPENAEGEFHFEIYVPHELNNQYSISSSFVKWIFSTEVTKLPEIPETGDKTGLAIAMCLLFVTGMTVLTMAVVPGIRKKKEGQSDD